MDFLRRLHPATGLRQDAARLSPSVAPRPWPVVEPVAARDPRADPLSPPMASPHPIPLRPAGKRSPAATSVPASTPASATAGAGLGSPGAAPTTSGTGSPNAGAVGPGATPSWRHVVATAPATPSSADIPRPAGTSAESRDDGTDVAPDARGAAGARPGSPPSIDPARTQGVAAADGFRPVDRANTATRSAASARVHDEPLRPQAMRDVVDAARPSGTSAPPVVHVTIDRIDVRLPPAPAPAARASTRPRPSSAVPALADYLRRGAGGAS